MWKWLCSWEQQSWLCGLCRPLCCLIDWGDWGCMLPHLVLNVWNWGDLQHDSLMCRWNWFLRHQHQWSQFMEGKLTDSVGTSPVHTNLPNKSSRPQRTNELVLKLCMFLYLFIILMFVQYPGYSQSCQYSSHPWGRYRTINNLCIQSFTMISA